MRRVDFSKPLIGVFIESRDQYIEIRNSDDINDLAEGTQVIIFNLNKEQKSRLEEYYCEIATRKLEEELTESFSRVYIIRENNGIRDISRRKGWPERLNKRSHKIDLRKRTRPQKVPMRPR